MKNSVAKEHNFHPQFRPDIDGLRAVAILSVLGFHAFPSKLRGGFVGVDIFFVISGFLISSIVFRSLHRGDFRFTEFYAHRIKRIFPALLVVLAASVSFGWFVLLPDEYRQLGKHVAAGAGFVQNFSVWTESGYFDIDSELKPLLHLWSLAIEEQFYLFYPVVIWVGWRVGLNVLVMVVALGLLSFAANIYSIRQDAIGAFFLPHTRGWELLAGATLAYLQLFRHKTLSRWLSRWQGFSAAPHSPSTSASREPQLNNLLSVSGALLLAVSVVGIHKGKVFPGWLALVPVAGAVLMIMAGPQAWINRRILAHKFMGWIGLISYPLYLWHWPILSFARILEAEAPAPSLRVAALSLSVLLAWLTYRFLEKPIRFGRKTWVKTASLAVLMVMVGGAGYSIFERGGFVSRMGKVDPAVLQLGWNDDQRESTCQKMFPGMNKAEFCRIAKPEDPTILLIGDSLAWQYYFGLAKATRDTRENVMAINQGGCAPFFGFSDREDFADCHDTSQKSFELALNLKSVHTVIFSNAPRGFSNGARKFDPEDMSPTYEVLQSRDAFDRWTSASFRRLSNKILSRGIKIIYVKRNPVIPFDLKACLALRPFLGATKVPCAQPLNVTPDHLKDYDRRLDELLRSVPEISVFDVSSLLCDQTRCWAMKDGKMLYRDAQHLSIDGSLYVGESLAQRIDIRR